MLAGQYSDPPDETTLRRHLQFAVIYETDRPDLTPKHFAFLKRRRPALARYIEMLPAANKAALDAMNQETEDALHALQRDFPDYWPDHWKVPDWNVAEKTGLPLTANDISRLLILSAPKEDQQALTLQLLRPSR